MHNTEIYYDAAINFNTHSDNDKTTTLTTRIHLVFKQLLSSQTHYFSPNNLLNNNKASIKQEIF